MVIHQPQVTSCWFQTVSLTEWYNNNNNNNNLTTTISTTCSSSSSSDGVLPLIDLRSNIDQTKCPIIISPNHNNQQEQPLVVHLPWDSLMNGERSCELPPRNKMFAILFVWKSQSLLDDITNFFMSTKSKVTGQSRKPWKVSQVILIRQQQQFRNEALALGITPTSTHQQLSIRHSSNHDDDDSSFVFTPLSRLWGPDPLVQNCILPQLKQLLSTTTTTTTNDTTNFKYNIEVWDLGCGSGRDVCFLAEEMKHFWMNQKNNKSHHWYTKKNMLQDYGTNNHPFPFKFVGIDNHKGSAKRCIPLWKHRNVHDITDTKLLDLKKLPLVQNILQEYHHNHHHHDKNHDEYPLLVIYAIRFLNRKLIHYMVHSNMIESGTIFALSHFCKERDGSPWNFDHPKVCSYTRVW